MNRRTLLGITLAVASVIFVGGATLYSQFGRPAPLTTPDPESGGLIRAHSPIVGPLDAPVTIVEFFDPSCETCRAFYPIVKQIMDAYGGKVRLVLRYAALHEGSDKAVAIIEAARLQGKFLPVLEALLARQPEWAVHGAPDLEKAWAIAGATGLDVARARTDALSPAIAVLLAQETVDLKAAGVEGTPTFFVNGKPLQSFGAQQLYDLVTAEVQAAGG